MHKVRLLKFISTQLISIRTETKKRMVGTSTTSSSSSSIASFGSFDDLTIKPAILTSMVKLICSYGGKILPRRDKLRYIGGETRVLTVDRNIPFPELQAKLGELCGLGPVSQRCQLPTDDLDALVSVTSDQDLTNVCEEYELAVRDLMHPIKIRVFLFPPRSLSPKPVVTESCYNKLSMWMERTAGYPSRRGRYDCPAYSPRAPQYLVHHGNHCQ